MSKLAKLIHATVTRNVKATQDLNFRNVSASINTQPVEGFGSQYQVRLGVSIKRDTFIDETLTLSKDDVWNEHIRFLKRDMIEEIFGEFRSLIIEARAAVYDKDYDRIKKLLAELEYNMFVEGL